MKNKPQRPRPSYGKSRVTLALIALLLFVVVMALLGHL
ncbi:hypothetical protein CCICO_03070 [Corynebacterium ciconiae DSM 44920]|nr:hypothetical protein CCICO_03070 [Corynebacterium ciconiae DSM 44920]